MKIHVVMDKFRFTGQFDIDDKHFEKVFDLFLKMSEEKDDPREQS